MQIARTSMIFTGLFSDFEEPIPDDVIEDLLNNVPTELIEDAYFGAHNRIHVPIRSIDGKIYYHTFAPITMEYNGGKVDLSEMPAKE